MAKVTSEKRQHTHILYEERGTSDETMLKKESHEI